jgi:hypothetical protein
MFYNAKRFNQDLRSWQINSAYVDKMFAKATAMDNEFKPDYVREQAPVQIPSRRPGRRTSPHPAG